MKNETTRRNMRVRRTRRDEIARVSKPKRRILPWWVPVAASLTLVLSITATVNVRSWIDLSNEQQQHDELNQRVQQMNEENLGLQEEIYYLKNDTDTIEREAKKYGLVRPQSKLKLSSRAGEMGNAEEPTNRQTPTNK
ncbi:MAG: septum formation initiator family protein [bacterium]|nr:septum formation initiator family protein [bacterium]